MSNCKYWSSDPAHFSNPNNQKNKDIVPGKMCSTLPTRLFFVTSDALFRNCFQRQFHLFQLDDQPNNSQTAKVSDKN